MKRLITVALVALFAFAPQQSPAPAPIVAELVFKCVTLTGLGGVAVMIYRCTPDYYLVRYQLDGEEPVWACSQASEKTLEKTNGRRCEGPWKEKDEPEFRAWVNNKTPNTPMFPCGPLGFIPAPVRTNWIAVTIEQDTGGGMAAIATVTVAPEESNFSVALLSASGMAGMTREEIRLVQDCDVIVTNGMATMGIIRARYETITPPERTMPRRRGESDTP